MVGGSVGVVVGAGRRSGVVGVGARVVGEGARTVDVQPVQLVPEVRGGDIGVAAVGDDGLPTSSFLRASQRPLQGRGPWGRHRGCWVHLQQHPGWRNF